MWHDHPNNDGAAANHSNLQRLQGIRLNYYLTATGRKRMRQVSCRDGVKTHWMKAAEGMIRAAYQNAPYTGIELNVQDKIATLQQWIDADGRYPLRKNWTALIEKLKRR
jgi:hypothetical protein